MNLNDLASVQQAAADRAELVRVLMAIDNAKNFRVVMSVDGSDDVSCPLPPSYVDDVRKVLQKRIVAVEKHLRDLGVSV